MTSLPPECVPTPEEHLLTESEVQRSFTRLLKTGVTPDVLDKVEALLDELRAESPLRHRLSVELDELRKMHAAKV
jgi:hypothetical protein